MIYRDPEINKGVPWAILFAAFVLFGIVGAMDYVDEQRAHEHYCDMVLEHKRSGGERGWPDYDGRMERGECDE